MYNRFFAIVVCLQFLTPYCISAQQANGTMMDWQNDRIADTLRLQLLDSLIRKVHWSKQVDSSLYYIEQQEQLAKIGGWEEWEKTALKNRGALYYNTGDYLSCIPAQEALIAVYDTTSAFRKLSEAHRKLAYALRKTNQDTESLKHYHDCLRFAEAAGEDGKVNLAAGLNSLGSYYLNRRAYDLAKEKYLASLALHRSINRTKGIYSNLNNLGLVYAMTEDYDKAIEYYQISLEIKKEAGDKRRMANTYGNIGDVYLAWAKEEEARQYFLQAKALQEELGLRDELARSLTQLGNLAIIQGKPREAIDLCNRSCTIAEEDQLWQAALACHKCLYDAHKALNNSTIALAEHEAYTAIKDSVFNMENSRKIAQIEAQLLYEKQLVEAEKKQIKLASQAERERLLRWVFLGSTLALALLSWLTFRLSRLRKRQNIILADKNDQISKDHTRVQQEADELRLQVEKLLEIPHLDAAIESPNDPWLETVERQVIELLVSRQELSAGSVASSLHLSNRQLLRKIQAATGMSTQLYLRECKLQLAQRYLETQQYNTVQEVAVACGFNTPSYFSKLYHQRFGKRPENLLK